MKTTGTTKRGYTLTTYTAAKPYRISGNGVRYYKQIVVWVNSRIGRVLYDRTIFIDYTQAAYPQP